MRVDVLVVKRSELGSGDGVLAGCVDDILREVIREDTYHVISLRLRERADKVDADVAERSFWNGIGMKGSGWSGAVVLDALTSLAGFNVLAYIVAHGGPEIVSAK